MVWYLTSLILYDDYTQNVRICTLQSSWRILYRPHIHPLLTHCQVGFFLACHSVPHLTSWLPQTSRNGFIQEVPLHWTPRSCELHCLRCLGLQSPPSTFTECCKNQLSTQLTQLANLSSRLLFWMRQVKCSTNYCPLLQHLDNTWLVCAVMLRYQHYKGVSSSGRWTSDISTPGTLQIGHKGSVAELPSP